jgi:hypothetical protein
MSTNDTPDDGRPMSPELRRRIVEMMDANPALGVSRGARTEAEQLRLVNSFLTNREYDEEKEQ